MDQGSHAEQTHTTASVPVSQGTPAATITCRARSVLLGRLAIVREMLSTMESVTFAGQRHIMAKIVAFFEDLIANECASGSGRARFLLAHLVHQLSCESRRPFPDAHAFQNHATDLLSMVD